MAFLDSIKKSASALFSKPKPDDSDKPGNDPAVYSVLNLHNSESTGDLVGAHNAVQLYYMPWMSAREYYHDFMHPDSHWTAEEKAIMAKKKKAAIAFSKMKSAERTFIGAIVQNKYDIKPSPVNPTDQSLADVYTALYNKTGFDNQTRIRDIDVIRESWIGGNAWQESFVEQSPGRAPRIIVKNQNNFAIYPDPNRRDLVTNYDCKFIDRVGWYSMDDLISCYPEMEDDIRASLTAPTSIYYQPDKAWADRQHEFFDQKNGRYKCIERQYKVFKRQFYGIDTKGNRQDLGYDLNKDAQTQYKQQNPDHQIYNEPEEFLYLAVACTSMSKYLYNGPYHCQPKDAVTGKILFTFVELIDEDVGAVPSGHVEHMVGPNKVIDSMVVNMLAQAKNASGVSRIGNPDAFDEATQIDLAKNASDGDRTFWTKTHNNDKNPITLMPQGTLTADTDKGINFATANLDDVSSTPPSLKGFSEGNVPAALNEQRIQQSFVQSQVQVTNYMNFLTQRAKLWMYYWNEYYTAEQVIRNIDKKEDNDPDYITINQLVQNEWGGVQRLNNLQDADAYEIVFEDSWQSPTNKDKIRKQISDLMQSQGVGGDPAMLALFASYFLQVSDLPQDFKSKAKAILDQKVQQAQQPPAPPAKPKDEPSISLSLKGDLHDPETIQFMEALGTIPPGFGQALTTSPSAVVKQAGDIADVRAKNLSNHGKVLDNHSKMQGIADSEAQATTPVNQASPTRAMQPA